MSMPANLQPVGRPRSLFWFSVDGTIDMSSPFWDTELLNALYTWSSPWRDIMYDSAPINLYNDNYYLRYGGTTYVSGIGFVTFPLDVGCLPNTVTVCVRRETGFLGQSNNGRVFLSGLRQLDIGSNLLTPLALNNWQLQCDSMVAPISFRGAVFTPCLVSYKLATMIPITKVVVLRRPASIIRRSRMRPFSPIAGYVPKPPPP